jgi:hypothetical protein
MAETLNSTPKRNRLIFDGHEYSVDRAKNVGALADPYWCDTYNKGRGKSFLWSIQFDAEERIINDDSHAPSVGFDGLNFLTIANWQQLLGISLSWSAPICTSTGKRYGMTYDLAHHLIVKCELRITQCDGCEFHVVASGENEEGQAFEIDAPAKFLGVYVHGSGRDTDESVRERLSGYLSLDNLKAGPLEFRHKYESGVEMVTAFFEPRA